MPPPLPIPNPAQNRAFNFEELLGSRFTALKIFIKFTDGTIVFSVENWIQKIIKLPGCIGKNIGIKCSFTTNNCKIVER